MATLQHLSFAALAGLATGNFVSPGLAKCMTLGDETQDGQREVLLVKCSTDADQDFGLMADGTIRTFAGECLAAGSADANSPVYATACEGSDLTQWDLTEHGYVKLQGSDMCLDVKASKKDDGTYETWDEIVLHDIVGVQLYDCHDFCTSRVNQLWSWAAYTGDNFGAADVENPQLGAVIGNMVSPGLEKCMVISDDNKNVALSTCVDGSGLNFEVLNGEIRIPGQGKCLIAESADPNSNVYLGECTGEFKWDLTPRGYLKLDGFKVCLDVVADLKDDGSRENWEEIKAHDTVNVHLYDCHQADTKRVNQLWEWSPVQPDSMATPPGCSTPEEAVNSTMAPEGSMPGDVAEADKLATGVLAGVLDDYSIGHVAISWPLASVASAVLLSAAAFFAFAPRRRVSDADSDSLLAPEE